MKRYVLLGRCVNATTDNVVPLLQMFDWILHNRDVFQMSYVEIGHNYSLAKSLQEEHQKFAVASMNVCVNINRILAVAVRLKEGNFCLKF